MTKKCPPFMVHRQMRAEDNRSPGVVLHNTAAFDKLWRLLNKTVSLCQFCQYPKGTLLSKLSATCLGVHRTANQALKDGAKGMLMKRNSIWNAGWALSLCLVTAMAF